jgi:hypothetical protein
MRVIDTILATIVGTGWQAAPAMLLAFLSGADLSAANLRLKFYSKTIGPSGRIKRTFPVSYSLDSAI